MYMDSIPVGCKNPLGIATCTFLVLNITNTFYICMYSVHVRVRVDVLSSVLYMQTVCMCMS